MRDEKRWWERRLRSVRVWAAVNAELDTLPCGGNGHLPHHDVLRGRLDPGAHFRRKAWRRRQSTDRGVLQSRSLTRSSDEPVVDQQLDCPQGTPARIGDSGSEKYIRLKGAPIDSIADLASPRFAAGIEGKLPAGEVRRLGIEDSLEVSLAMAPQVPAPVRARIDAWTEDLKTGRLTFPVTYSGPEFET